MTPQELRNSIFQLAIQGKLVEQRPEEGTGEELYQQIQKEKEKLIKEGIIKKRKPLTMINDDEIPFDIPANWCWARMINICSFIGDIDHKMPKAVDEGISLLSAKDINPDGSLNYSNNVKRISLNDYERLSKKAKPQRGDIIFSRIGTLGKVGYVDTDETFLVSYSCCIIRRIIVDLKFLGICLQGPQMQYRIFEAKTGIGVPDLGMKMIHSFFVPLPPLAEQKRIVSKIEELMPLVEQYEEAWNRLEELNKRFPTDLQKSILQYAIQGKLVEQRPEEGTGEELYQIILKEKQLLLKEGKIKKKKPLPIISEAEIPFEIPSCWRWVRLADIYSILNGDRGKNYPSKSTLSRSGIPFISALNLNDGTVKKDENLLCLSQAQYDALNSGKLIEGDSVVCIRGSLGKHGRYPFEKGAIASSLVILRKNSGDFDLSDYLSYYLDSPLFFSEIKKHDNGTAQPNLSAKNLELFLFPLPSFDEQKRIVRILDELLPMCEVLKWQIG